MKKTISTIIICIIAIFFTATSIAQTSSESKKSAGGYLKASAGLGYRIAAIPESVKEIQGLEDLSKKQRSGTVLKVEGGFFINSEQTESIGLVYQRFGSKANGPVFLGSLIGTLDFKIEERISLLALVLNRHVKFGKTSNSGATFSVGAGYNHYNGNFITTNFATSEKFSKGGLGYLAGAEIDLALSKNIFFTTGLSFSAGSVRLEEGEDGKENLSMIVGGVGIKFKF